MIIRPIEVVECAICGREFDKIRMKEIFTGRVRYICPECDQTGNNEIDAKNNDWRLSYKGKMAIEKNKKHM